MTKEDQTIEVAGKDTEAAIAAGLSRLGVPREAVEIEVLDEGREGVFGLGARAARVRLTVKQAAPPKKKQKPSKPPEPKKPPKPPSKPPTEPEKPAAPDTEKVAVKKKQEQEEGKVTENQKIRVAKEVMEKLLATMGMDARVEVERAEPGPKDKKVPPLEIDVYGEGTEALIGREGKALNALQTITRLIVGRRLKEWVHLVVDVRDHKSERAEALRNLAHRMADQAVDTDRTVILEPMPPHERRVVHVALYDDDRVTTESIYEGERRRVTIIPKEEEDQQ